MSLTSFQTQKTVCKHLLEDPYLYQVVDDPIYASMVSTPLTCPVATNSRDSELRTTDVSIRARKTLSNKAVGLWALKATGRATH